MTSEQIEQKELEQNGYQVVSYNDGMMSRRRHSMCVFFEPNTKSLHEFTGSDIDGLCVILSKDYNKRGKWSSTTYRIAIPQDCVKVVWTQDWDNGTYITTNVWEEAYQSFKNKDEKLDKLPFEAFEHFVRIRLSKAAEKMDENKSKTKQLFSKELIEAKLEREKLKIALASKIAYEEKAIEDRHRLASEKAEAAEIARKNKELKEKIKGKLSLEEMQALYQEL